LKPPAGERALDVRRLKARAVRLSVPKLDIPPFDAEVSLGSDGTLQRAVLSDGKLKLDLTPKDKAMQIALEARNWKAPLGPPVEFEDLTLEAVFEGQQAAINNVSGKIGFSPVKGSARASWNGSSIQVSGDFSVTNGDLSKLMPVFTRDFAAAGQLSANANFTLQGTTLENLFAEPKVEATFNIEKGTLNNVDLVRAVQSPSRDGVRGGRTSFNSLTGSMSAAGRTYSYRQLQLASGPMQASGNFDVAPNGDLSGRVSAELGSKTFTVARGTLAVVGNLKTPVLRQ
jgi:hypothetical protein